ncbi:hypothetical protein WH47_00488, partial [Habropoda laboriosa]
SQCWPPHRQRPSFPYNYSISSCAYSDIEEMNGIGCWAKLHSDNYLLAALCLAPFIILKNNTCQPTVQIIAEFWHLSLQWIRF